MSIPLTSITRVSGLTFASSLVGLLSEVVSFALEKSAGLILEELEAGLLGAEKDRLKLSLLAVVILELSLELVRWSRIL